MTDDIYNDSKSAVLKEAEQRDYGTSSEDIEAYTGVAAGTVAAGVCAVYATPAASPVCYAVGQYLGEIGGKYIVKAWNSLFSDDSEWKKYQKREMEKAQQAIHEVALQSIELIYWNQWYDAIYKTIIMHHELFPGKNYTYIDAVKDIINTSKEINYPVEVSGKKFVLGKISGIEISVDNPQIVNGAPYFGMFPIPFEGNYYRILEKYKSINEESLYNLIYNRANSQLNNIQKTQGALVALFIAGFESSLVDSPEVKRIIQNG